MEYLKAEGINYAGTIPKIKKSETPLQPIFEALTNSLESIKILEREFGNTKKGHIILKLFFEERSLGFNGIHDFQKIEITDTGTGFNDLGFQRLKDLNDNTKGYSNQGSGRVQYLHAFDKTKISSTYKDESSSTGFRRRIFTLSKSNSFLDKNAIIRLEDGDKKEAAKTDCFTSLIFEEILIEKDKKFFAKLTIKELRESIIKRYLAQFCENKENLPDITIESIIGDEFDEGLTITSNDIPMPDQSRDISVYYSKVEGANIEKTSKKETLNLKAFIMPCDKLDENGLKLVSKGEIAKEIHLESLLKTDQIEGNRYLFLLSGGYIDNKDSDTRGGINILKGAEFKKQSDLLLEEEVLLEDIEEQSNKEILKMYDKINEKNQEKRQNIEELQKMFLLDPRILLSLDKKIGINDSDDSILKKVYEADAKEMAEGDAKIKRRMKELLELNPANDDYNNKLGEQVDALVQAIPLQNRTALTRYVARRKLVLELFGKIIEEQLEIQQTDKGSIGEKLLHNLIFQQSSNNPGESDLWLINEDFIYFEGTSEDQLGKILLDDEKILKEELSEEEEKYRLKQRGDVDQKRPDILLFPKEGKCIIIEFKSLKVNASNHLNQISRYAALINNLSEDTYNFTTYYGYLIGENIDIDDVQDNDSDYKSAYHLDYIYRPYKRVIGKFGKSDGSLYTEVIKYSTLLERALMRNKIFIDKITETVES